MTTLPAGTNEYMGFAFKGGPELLALMDELPKKLAVNAFRKGLTAAAAPVREQARSMAKRKSGAMAASIKSGSPRVNQDGTISIKVRLKGKHAFLGVFFEYGIRPHLISVAETEDAFQAASVTRKGRKKTSGATMRTINTAVRRGSLKIGRDFVGPVVMHPGVAASPFMRPALEMRANDAILAFGGKVSQSVSWNALKAPVLAAPEPGEAD